MNKTSSCAEVDLFIAAAEAKQNINALLATIEGKRAKEAIERFETKISEIIRDARNGAIPMEDAILHLNELSGKEVEIDLANLGRRRVFWKRIINFGKKIAAKRWKSGGNG